MKTYEGHEINIYTFFITTIYSSKIVEKEGMLRTVSNIGICCSCDKVGTVYLV
jgi:hypothetical protein